MPSRTSLFSGQLGIHHGCVSHTGTRAETFPDGVARKFRSAWGHTNWMRQLRNAGMNTVTFSSFGERHAAWHWYAGFEEIHDTGHFGHEICDDVIPRVLDWLERNAQHDDWFLHVNLWDVHVPYRAPEDFGLHFADTPLPDPWQTEERLQQHQGQPGMRSSANALFLRHSNKRPDLNPKQLTTLQDVKLMHDAYDTAVLYTDLHVGRLLDALVHAGVLDETAIVVSADHGECLGELNAYGGHCFADHNVARVPLIVRWPGVTDGTAGRHETGLHYHIDLAATVCDLLGIPAPSAWDAESMADALRGAAATGLGRDNLVISQLAQTCQRALCFRRDGNDYIYIKTFAGGSYELPEEMLFDLTSDPHEEQDIANTRPELVEQARCLLAEWQHAMLTRSTYDDPLKAVLEESLTNDATDSRTK